MIIKNKNIYYRTYAAFTVDKNAGNIPNTAVVYIADRKIIYTNGVEFGMTASEDEVSKAFVSKNEHVITDEDGNPEVDEHGVEKKYTGTDLVFTDNDGNIAAQLTINPYRNILSVTDNNGHTGSMYLPQLRFDGYSLQATYDNWENVITLSTLNPSIRIKKFVSEIPHKWHWMRMTDEQLAYWSSSANMYASLQTTLSSAGRVLTKESPLTSWTDTNTIDTSVYYNTQGDYIAADLDTPSSVNFYSNGLADYDFYQWVNDTDTLDCEAGDIIAVGVEGNWKIYSLAEVKTGKLTTEYKWKYVANLGANIQNITTVTQTGTSDIAVMTQGAVTRALQDLKKYFKTNIEGLAEYEDIKDLQNQIKALDDTNSLLEAKYSERITQLTAIITNKVLKAITTLEEDMVIVQKAITELRGNDEQLEREITENKDAIAALSITVQENKDAIAAHQAKILQLEQSIANVNEQVEGLEQKTENISRNVVESLIATGAAAQDYSSCLAVNNFSEFNDFFTFSDQNSAQLDQDTIAGINIVKLYSATTTQATKGCKVSFNLAKQLDTAPKNYCLKITCKGKNKIVVYDNDDKVVGGLVIDSSVYKTYFIDIQSTKEYIPQGSTMSFGIDFDALDIDGNHYTDDVYVAYVDVVEQPVDIGALNLELNELSGRITSNSDNIRNLSEQYERVLNTAQAAADGISTINGNIDIVQGNLNDEVARAKATEADLYSKINMISSEYHWQLVTDYQASSENTMTQLTKDSPCTSWLTDVTLDEEKLYTTHDLQGYTAYSTDDNDYYYTDENHIYKWVRKSNVIDLSEYFTKDNLAQEVSDNANVAVSGHGIYTAIQSVVNSIDELARESITGKFEVLSIDEYNALYDAEYYWTDTDLGNLAPDADYDQLSSTFAKKYNVVRWSKDRVGSPYSSKGVGPYTLAELTDDNGDYPELNQNYQFIGNSDVTKDYTVWQLTQSTTSDRRQNDVYYFVYGGKTNSGSSSSSSDSGSSSTPSINVTFDQSTNALIFKSSTNATFDQNTNALIFK